LKVLIDKHIPFIKGILESYAEVTYLAEEEFSAARVANADALIIRTTIRCDASLLEGSRVRFIATATIGTDHIDMAYCRNHAIQVVSCPGCNAPAVCDYVEEALRDWCTRGHAVRTLGVVGVGHVGELVAAMAEKKGIEVLVNDAPKGLDLPLEQLATRCDAITFHVPLTRDGEYPTYHMADAQFLRHCRPNTLIINAARGGVVCEQALLESGLPYVVDCWENEPRINPDMVTSESAFLVSYHIAGYSVNGKKKASEMCIDAFLSFFGIETCQNGKKYVPLQVELQNTQYGDSKKGWLRRVSEQLKARPEDFTSLRKQYKLR